MGWWDGRYWLTLTSYFPSHSIPLSIVCDWWYSLVKGIVRYRLVAKPDNEWSELERWDDKEMACPHSLLSSFSLPPPFNFRSENEGWAKRWGTKRWIDEWEKIPVHSFLASFPSLTYKSINLWDMREWMGRKARAWDGNRKAATR